MNYFELYSIIDYKYYYKLLYFKVIRCTKPCDVCKRQHVGLKRLLNKIFVESKLRETSISGIQ